MTNTTTKGKKYLKSLILGVLFVSGCSSKGDPLGHLTKLETGDLIFLDLDCGELCDAIETVTLEQFQVTGPRLSHVGMVYRNKAEVLVLEAWPKGGVQAISLSSFISRVKAGENEAGGFYIGALSEEARPLGLQAARRIYGQIGKRYDDAFDWKHDKFYCSELIHFGFIGAGTRLLGNLDPLFMPRPMYFGPQRSGEYKVWESYYQEIGEEVPNQELGISPLGIYLEGKRRLFTPSN